MVPETEDYSNPHLLISPKELREQISQEKNKLTIVIDVRSVEEFAAGHLPGAVHLDLFGISLIDTDQAPLDAFMWMIAHLFMLRGVSADRNVVVYDKHSGIRAARAFWFLEFFGHTNVRVLNGGMGAWQREGLQTTLVSISPQAGQWDIRKVNERIATWKYVKSKIGVEDAIILDTRSDSEYLGATVRARRGGAIPGSVNVEWTCNLASDGVFKTASELHEIYKSVGITPDKDVISYCQGGYRAAHSYLALRLLGYPRVRNYIGSWKEWGDREDLPIEIPTGV